jgi:hypothetical protein
MPRLFSCVAARAMRLRPVARGLPAIASSVFADHLWEQDTIWIKPGVFITTDIVQGNGNSLAIAEDESV